MLAFSLKHCFHRVKSMEGDSDSTFHSSKQDILMYPHCSLFKLYSTMNGFEIQSQLSDINITYPTSINL